MSEPTDRTYAGEPRQRKPQTGHIISDPEFRRRRAEAAGRQSAENRRRALIREIQRKFVSKEQAYTGGYRNGYQAAYQWWKLQYTRLYREAEAQGVILKAVDGRRKRG